MHLCPPTSGWPLGVSERDPEFLHGVSGSSKVKVERTGPELSAGPGRKLWMTVDQNKRAGENPARRDTWSLMRARAAQMIFREDVLFALASQRCARVWLP